MRSIRRIPAPDTLDAPANYAGGDAKIGLGLMLLAMPIFVPTDMLIGGFAVGGWRQPKTATFAPQF